MLSLNIKEPSKTINILVDGDDYLYSGDVLDILNEKYIHTNCLITYGSHISSKGIQGKKYPRLIREFNLYRKGNTVQPGKTQAELIKDAKKGLYKIGTIVPLAFKNQVVPLVWDGSSLISGAEGL